MKKILVVLLLAAPGILFAQKRGSYELSGRLVDNSARKVYLTHLENGGWLQVIDSAVVTDGKYILHGFTEGVRAWIMNCDLRDFRHIPANAATVELFLAPGKHSVVHTGAFKNAVFSNSPENKEFKTLRSKDSNYEGNASITAIGNEYNAAVKSNDTSSASALRKKLQNAKWKKRADIYKDFFDKNTNSLVALFALQEYAGAEHDMSPNIAEEIKPLYEKLPEYIRKSGQGRVYGEKLNTYITFNKIVVGTIAPDFELPDTTGTMVRLSSFRGKYVFLDFWASWCGPCRAENPHVVQAYKDYHNAGFNILSVSLDFQSQKEAWMAAIRHDHLGAWPHVADLLNQNNKAAMLYGVTGIPQNFLIGPDGKILARSLRGEDLEKQLAIIFKKDSQ